MTLADGISGGIVESSIRNKTLWKAVCSMNGKEGVM